MGKLLVSRFMKKELALIGNSPWNRQVWFKFVPPRYSILLWKMLQRPCYKKRGILSGVVVAFAIRTLKLLISSLRCVVLLNLSKILT